MICQPPGLACGYTPLKVPANPTEPAGRRVRGVLRRGTFRLGWPPLRYAKPGAKPVKATVYSLPVWRCTTSSAVMPRICATSARSSPL